MAYDDLGLLHILRESLDTAVGTVERGKAAAYVQTIAGAHKSTAWAPGKVVKGVFLTSGLDSERVRVASPGSTIPVANGLLPGDTRLPGERLAVLVGGDFGIPDPDLDLPDTATAVAFADENSESIQASLDGSMVTGEGMATKTQFAGGDLNGGNLSSVEGTIWTDYVATKDLPRLAAPEDLFIRSLVLGDTSRQCLVRLVKGPAATIPFEEVHIEVSTDAVDATIPVNLNTGTVIFGTAIGVGEEPLDINGFRIQHPVSSAGKFVIETVAELQIWEIATRDAGGGAGIVTRTKSHISSLTIPGGWRGLGVTKVVAGSHQNSVLNFHIAPPGEFRVDSLQLHFGNFETVEILPFFRRGSVTGGVEYLPEGTRIEGRGRSEGAGGDEEASLTFGVVLEKVPT